MVKKSIEKIQGLLGIKTTRSRNISKHVFRSFVYKGGGILANLMLIPLTIEFLDNENYGVWLTLSSFIAWFSFFDIGLGNGLRNKFAEAKSLNRKEEALGYVSTAYFSIGIISLVFFAAAVLTSLAIDWTVVFNTSSELQKPLHILMPVVFGTFAIRLIATLMISIYTADQHHSINDFITFITAAGSLLLIWILTKTTTSSLLLFGIVFSVFPVLILIALNRIGFSNRFKEFKPRRSYFKKTYFKEIFGLGVNFFIIQIALVAMFSTDNIIITQIFSPEAVVPYNIAYKYMGISSMVFTMVLVPYWSSITEAYTKGEIEWIRNAVKNLTGFAAIAVAMIFVMILASPYVYRLWLGELVTVPMKLTIAMAVFFTITILYAPFNYFINGIGKIKLHTITFVIGAVFNIPLSILLAKNANLGVEGVIVATSICIFPNLILFPVQYHKIISNTASGIWNK